MKHLSYYFLAFLTSPLFARYSESEWRDDVDYYDHYDGGSSGGGLFIFFILIGIAIFIWNCFSDKNKERITVVCGITWEIIKILGILFLFIGFILTIYKELTN